MSIDEAVEWFGNLNQVCLALNIAPQNMTKWKKQGYIPLKQQFRIAILTKGELLTDNDDPYLVRNPKKPKKHKQGR
jgi:hypothetical protein